MVAEEEQPKEQYMSFAMAAIQRATIEKLRKDNDSLKEELFLENKFSVTPVDNIAGHRMAAMQEEADTLTRKIQLEQRKVALADVENQSLQEKLRQQLDIIKLAGGINSATDKAVALQKEIKRNESRRQQASVQYNEAFTHCKKLRAQIDSLRRERLVFDGIYTKLDKELQEKKKEMAKIIDVTNKAFEQREKCMSEMSALKTKADKEQAQFESDWKKLGAVIDQDKRNRELLRQRDMEERNRKTQELLKNREDALAGRSVKSKNGKRGKYKTDEVETMDKVQLLGQAFQKIQTATGIQEIDELIEKFKTADDQNYTLFTYVNELNQEIAKLEEQVKVIEDEIESAQKQAVSRESSRLKTQLEMEERLKSNEEMADIFQKRYEAASKTVAELRNGVQSMFLKFGCGTPAVRELLGDATVTESNLLQCMSVVEQRVNEVLRVYGSSLQRSGEDADHLKVPLGQAALPYDSMRVVIQPPSTNDEEYEDMDVPDGGDDSEPKPLGQEQLLAKVRGTLQRKGATAIFRVPEHSKRSKAATAPRAAGTRS